MNALVVDTSVVMGWAFEDKCDRYCLRVLDALAKAAVLVPPIWPLEVANVLCVAERRKRITRADATRFLSLLGGLPVEVIDPLQENDMQNVYLLACQYGLSAYDAAYLQLSMVRGVPLATRDTALRKAARKAGVSLF